ncbi:MAG: Uma2 family endonuclease [Hydrogenothermaceae bacterium]|nr:Uma2 family endonuclease [Hydrogenothermaceae bacterium]
MGLPIEYIPNYTVRDWENWQGDWELIEGVAFALASPSIYHQLLVSNLIYTLRNSIGCENCKVIPEIDYYISENTVVRPDVVVSCRNLSAKLTVTPEIIFEVISESTVKVDEEIKKQIYEREGVSYYILVYPFENRKKVKIFHLKDGFYRKVFEDFEGEFEFSLNSCSFKVDISKIW